MADHFPDVIWDSQEFHKCLMESLDEAYSHLLSQDSEFEEKWRQGRCVSGTKTSIRQAPMLGGGASGREEGGFLRFAERYAETEGHGPLGDRYGFERYLDFGFYTSGSWHEGMKTYIMASECESNSAELLGELAGLLSARSPFKYLFIHGDETLFKLNEYCSKKESPAFDWPGTTYYVIEIPVEPTPPSKWTTFEAHINCTGDRIQFAEVSGGIPS